MSASNSTMPKPVGGIPVAPASGSSSPGKPAAPSSGKPAAAAPAAGSDINPKGLSIFDMIVYGLIMMVPIAPFSIYAGVADASNNMAALAYLIAFFAMIFSVLSFGVMIRTFPSSGSIYTYTTKSFGPALGFIAGWLMLLQYMVTPDLVTTMAGEALNQYVPGVPVWGWCVLILAFVVFVATRGIKTTMAVNRAALVGEMIVLGMFIVFSIRYIIMNPSTTGFTAAAFVNPSKFDFGGLMSGVSLAVFSFVGFGCVATVTEQARDPRRGPGRAMLVMVCILAVMFVVTCYLAACVDPTGELSRSNVNNGFYLIAERVGGTWFGEVCAIAVALSQGVFTGLVGLVSVSQILNVMGRSGSLPKPLARREAKNNVPIVAMLFVAIVSLVLLPVFLAIGMDGVAKVVNFGALSTYFLLNLCVIAFYWVKRKDHSNPLRMLVFPLIGAAVVGGIFLSLDTMSHVIGVIWIIVGIAYYLVATRVLKREVKMG